MVDVETYFSDPAQQAAFPRFAEANGYYTTLNPGDLLYIPYGWWHFLTSDTQPTISISFWALTKKLEPTIDADGKVLLTPLHLVRVRRNIEEMILKSFVDSGMHPASAFADLMQELRTGKYSGTFSAILPNLRSILRSVNFSDAQQDKFLIETIESRYGIDHQSYV